MCGFGCRHDHPNSHSNGTGEGKRANAVKNNLNWIEFDGSSCIAYVCESVSSVRMFCSHFTHNTFGPVDGRRNRTFENTCSEMATPIRWVNLLKSLATLPTLKHMYIYLFLGPFRLNASFVLRALPCVVRTVSFNGWPTGGCGARYRLVNAIFMSITRHNYVMLRCREYESHIQKIVPSAVATAELALLFA